MILKNGSRGDFFSCSKFPKCTGSMSVREEVIDIGIRDIAGKLIYAYDKVDCIINDQTYTKKQIVFKNGCFGVMAEDDFIPLYQCNNIEHFKHSKPCSLSI